MSVNSKCLYDIGEAKLTHDMGGFTLKDATGALSYEQKSKGCYTVNSDFNWYELGDIISIGTHGKLFYCFPKIKGDIVAKIRLATEEIYKILTEREINGAVATV